MALKVLLADASAPAKNQGKKILEDAGYEVVACSNGLEAQRKINERVPDLAILDVFMPGYTGLELCGRLRANAPTASLPVILTVGKLEPYRTEDGDQVRANAVVIKPFGDQELVSAVRNLIGSPGSARKASSAPVAARNKPLLEWWDPASEAIERSIAAAQLRRGVQPTSAKTLPAAPRSTDTGSAVPAQDAPAGNGEEADPEPLAEFLQETLIEDLGDAGEGPPSEAAATASDQSEVNVQLLFDPDDEKPFDVPAAEPWEVGGVDETAASDAEPSHSGEAHILAIEIPSQAPLEELAVAQASGPLPHVEAADAGCTPAQMAEPSPFELPPQIADEIAAANASATDCCESALGCAADDADAAAGVPESTQGSEQGQEEVALECLPAVEETVSAELPEAAAVDAEDERVRRIVEAVLDRLRPQIVESVLRELHAATESEVQ